MGVNFMCSICGIVDFSAKTSNIDALLRMWRALAPLGRGYTYANGGIAISCERTPIFSATHCAKNKKNRTLALGSVCSGFFAEDLLFVYESEGLSALRSASAGLCFALVDENEKLLLLSASNDPLHYAEIDGKIIFATKKEALGAFADKLPFTLGEISPRGVVVYSKT